MGVIELNHITKTFGNVEAVRDLNLTIHDKEFLTLLGPSGCGKSTTLNLIAGLEKPTSGEIRIDGQRVTHIPPARRDIAMVFQNYALYPHMTVYRNLGFALEIRKVDKSTIDGQVREAAQMLGIDGLLDRYPRQLSGGQRQRVALGRAIVRQPKAFLLDEPLSNLDAVLRVQMRAELKILFNRLQTTAVFVTHDQAEAMTMSDRIAIFNHGELQQVGTPLQIYRAPVNQFVAGFVGSPPMNFLNVNVTSAGEIDFSGLTIAAPDDCNLSAYHGRSITLGARPEDLRLTSGDGLRCTVEVVEHLGSSQLVYTRLQDRLFAIQLSDDEEKQIRPGENLSLELPTRQLYLFDAASGKAVRTPGALVETVPA